MAGQKARVSQEAAGAPLQAVARAQAPMCHTPDTPLGTAAHQEAH